MKVAVGSTNPVKIKAVEEAFSRVWPETTWQVTGVDVDSNVSSQPMSYTESIRGAKDRARKALNHRDSDFGVGIEAGIQKIGKHYFTSGFAVVINKNRDLGIGSSISMIIPPKMMTYISEGKELGIVDDIIFGKENSKHAEGHFGLMTNNVITRTNGYIDGVIAALVRFLHPQLFEETVEI